MISTILVNSIVIITIAFMAFFAHSEVLTRYHISIQYTLKPIYIFLSIATLIIYIVLDLLSQFKKFNGQIGFLYLATFMLKITCFAIIFYNSIISRELSKTDSLNLLIPVFIFLFVEVIFLSKILNRK